MYSGRGGVLGGGGGILLGGEGVSRGEGVVSTETPVKTLPYAAAIHVVLFNFL